MTVEPESVGFSSDRLAAIDRFFQHRYIDSGKLPGMQALIARRGMVVHCSSLGLRDRERNQPVSDDTIFRIYSMTKPITSLALMMLVEEGQLSLLDPVQLHIPTWKDLRVYVSGSEGSFTTAPLQRPMLIVDLLRHTSGLTYGFQRRNAVDAAYRSVFGERIAAASNLSEMVEQLAGLPLDFSPGSAWNYSMSTDVAGYLVEKLSGVPFADFLRERIFGPLRMHDTDFYVPANKIERFAACYAVNARGKAILQDDPLTSPYLKPPTYHSGGAGLVSTSRDYLRFCRMVLSGGTLQGVRIIGRKTLELMAANHLPEGKDLPALSVSMFSEASYAGIGFGLGFATTLNAAKTLVPGSNGDLFWGGLASTFFWIDPLEDLVVILMAQLMPSSSYPLRRELRTMTYAALVD
jgi:CubicO group peptidase (beta-lactamase class C family)